MWRTIANQLLGVLARIIWSASRPEYVQFSAWRVIRATYPILSAFYRAGIDAGLRKDWRGSIMNRMLSVFTRIDPGFTLHLEIRSPHLLADMRRRHGGVLVCTGHFGLTLAAHKGLLDMGLEPVFIGSGENGARDMSGWNWGTPRHVDLLDADRPDVLTQASKRVRGGAVLIGYVDYDPAATAPRAGAGTQAVSPNAFAWAQLERVPILFMASSLADDGRIVLEFFQPANAMAGNAREALACADEFCNFIGRRMGRDYVIRRPKHAALRRLSP